MNLVPVISEGREFDKHKEYLEAEIAPLQYKYLQNQ